MIHEATFPAGVRSGLWPAALLLGTLSFLAIGFLMATVAPNARAAQVIGMILFFPMWLLSGGRTAPDVMGETIRRTSDALPLTHVVERFRIPGWDRQRDPNSWSWEWSYWWPGRTTLGLLASLVLSD